MVDIEKVYNEILELVDTFISSARANQIKEMYEDLGERLILAPASSYSHFHNAFPGGYIDHVLRVTNFAIRLRDQYIVMGMDVSDYSIENVVFCALHHDLGKLGLPFKDGEKYLINPADDWWRKNRGQMYKINDRVPFALVPDASLFILQHYRIPIEWNEWLTIRIHDGVFDEANKPYFIAKGEHSQLRTNLPYLIHTADMLASRKEYEDWRNDKYGDTYTIQTTHKVEQDISDKSSDKQTFEDIFNGI